MFTYLTSFSDWYRNLNGVSLSVITYADKHNLTPKNFLDIKGSQEVWSESIFWIPFFTKIICVHINQDSTYTYLDLTLKQKSFK